MKNYFRLIAVCIVLVTVALMATGCGGAKVVNNIDTNKTQLYVGLYKAGIGQDWLDDAIKKFEKKYEKTSFEEGKTGVQVMIAAADRTTMANDNLKESFSTSQIEVVFGEGNSYYDWVNNGLLLDISDVVNEKLTDFDEDRSIADKMDKELLTSMTKDGKVYALPFWEGYYGLVYNATLFDEKGWYVAADGSFTSSDGNLGNGPDGKKGTYDDGMPATYEDFYKLCDKIYKDNCQPLQWAGASAEYFTWLTGSLFADYEGREGFNLNYNMNGTANLVDLNSIDVSTSAHKVEQVAITDKNAYELSRQEGIFYATQFAQNILQNPNNYNANSCLSGSFKQQESQLAFVKNVQSTGSTPVAMMVDGSWWENEASSVFKETFNGDKFSAEDEYKWMPLPKATAQKVGSKNTLVSPLEPYCFINANIKKEKTDVAKSFLKFCHSDQMLARFTEITGIKKPYDYEIDTENLTPFAISVIEASENSDVILPMGNSKVFVAAPTSFRIANLFCSKYSANDMHSVLLTAALSKTSGSKYVYSYADFFKGIYNYRKDILWTTFANLK